MDIMVDPKKIDEYKKHKRINKIALAGGHWNEDQSSDESSDSLIF